MNEHSFTSSYVRKRLTEVVDNEVLSNRLALNVPDEGYSRNWTYLMKVIPETERTWWRLFQKLNVPDEGYSRNWTYLMQVIPETRRKD
jgi:hypothetical protein